MSATLPPLATASTHQPTALQKVRQNTAFLIDPAKSTGPSRRSTRALLRTARYIGIFLFWRLVRYAKYAAVGAISAAVAGTAIGTLTGGIGFILAPPGIMAGAGVGLVWGVAKFGWKTLAGRVRRGDVDTASARGDEKKDGGHAELDEVPKMKVGGPSVDVW